jgi:hypothetical protein
MGGSVFWVVAAVAVLLLGFAFRTEPPSSAPRVAASTERFEPGDDSFPDEIRPSSLRAPAATPRVPSGSAEAGTEIGRPASDESDRSAVRPPPAGPAGRLVERALRDARRISGGGVGHWTAQLAVLCDPGGAEALASKAGNDSPLYVLPAEVGERACFRICWGSYGDANAARAAVIPSELLPKGGPTPKRIAEILP